MKKLTLFTTLVFSLTIFSSTCYAEWTKVDEDWLGTFYVDFASIRKVYGYVYFWRLSDFLKPDTDGELSYKIYTQGDCKLFRYKVLNVSAHKQAMGEGTGEVAEPIKELEGWIYPPPNSAIEHTLKKVCVVVQKYREQ